MLFLDINYIHKNAISLLPSTDMAYEIHPSVTARVKHLYFIHLSP